MYVHLLSSIIRVDSFSINSLFQLGIRVKKFWNVIKYFSSSLFSKHIFIASLYIELNPCIILGVKISNKRVTHSFLESFKVLKSKSSI